MNNSHPNLVITSTDDRRLDDRLGPFRFPGCVILFIAFELTLLCNLNMLERHI